MISCHLPGSLFKRWLASCRSKMTNWFSCMVAPPFPFVEDFCSCFPHLFIISDFCLVFYSMMKMSICLVFMQMFLLFFILFWFPSQKNIFVTKIMTKIFCQQNYHLLTDGNDPGRLMFNYQPTSTYVPPTSTDWQVNSFSSKASF